MLGKGPKSQIRSQVITTTRRLSYPDMLSSDFKVVPIEHFIVLVSLVNVGCDDNVKISNWRVVFDD